MPTFGESIKIILSSNELKVSSSKKESSTLDPSTDGNGGTDSITPLFLTLLRTGTSDLCPTRIRELQNTNRVAVYYFF